MAALAKAQGEIGDIPRNRTVTVQPRSGGQSYHFKYATLSAIIDAIKKPLSGNGLAYTQAISHDAEGGFYVLTTTLYCGEQWISSKVPLIAEGGSNQQFGSALTYMKRYALAALLGIAADEDDDGNAADGNEVKALADKPHGPRLSPPPKVPAPDPITTGRQQTRLEAPNIAPHGDLRKPPGTSVFPGDMSEERREDYPKLVPIFIAGPVPVPLTADQNGADWMAWGQSFMAIARTAPDAESLAALEKSNAVPMKNMESQAPKMYTNMTLALIKVRKALERTNGG